MVDPFAVLGSFFPAFGGFELVAPPGEGAALFGSVAIDLALAVFQEDAVVGAGVFSKR